MNLNTRITEMLGIQYPIIQGAIQWLSRAELVAAVSNAGGLGMISALTFATADELRQEIQKTRTLTAKPFAVNITLIPGIRDVNHEQYIQASIDEGVTIIETSGRNPEPYMKLLKDAGVRVMHRAARIRDARTAERIGVDAVTIVGFEAAGHPGREDVGSLVRIPTVVDAVKIPVIAAGGIADGRGLVAALSLGAEGVLMGTRFLTSQECRLHPKIKQWLISATETDTRLIGRGTAGAARVMTTELARRILEMEKRGATRDEIRPLMSHGRAERAYFSGDIDDSIIYGGQSAGLIHDIISVSQIMQHIISQAELIGELLRYIGIYGD